MLSEVNTYKRNRRKAQVNITSLIDVMFMLLLFFVVTTTFVEQPALQVDLPESKTATSGQVEEFVVTLNKEGVIFLNDRQLLSQGLLVELKKIAQNNTEASVVLKADQDVSYGKIIEIMDVIRESKVRRVVALTDVIQ